jgi:hypothetical protein
MASTTRRVMMGGMTRHGEIEKNLKVVLDNRQEVEYTDAPAAGRDVCRISGL